MVYMTRTHGFYSIYTNIQWNNCHFPTELVQMFQLISVWNFATIHHLLQCCPICFSRTERRHIVHATLLLTCAQMCRSSLNRKTGRQTARILIRLIMQFEGHCSRWCIVAKFQTLTSWNIWTNSVRKWQLFHCMFHCMCSGHIYHNFSFCDDLSKFGKECLNSLKCEFCTFFLDKIAKVLTYCTPF